jgi:hypothetical protein
MVSENEIILAFLFKRSGKEKMSFSELYLNLSIDLNWFSPEEAKKILNDVIKKKLLIKEDNQLLLSFDLNKIKIPIGFSPSKQVFIEKKNQEVVEDKNIVTQIVKRINEKTKLEKKHIIDKINESSKEKNIIEEIAALLVGKEYEIEINDLLKETENKII